MEEAEYLMNTTFIVIEIEEYHTATQESFRFYDIDQSDT